jgi:hypothetical protein
MEPRRHHEVHEHRPRTGDEPMHARSPLRMRLVLAFTGLANGLLGVGIFGFWLRALPFAVFFAVVTVIALGNIVVVAHRIRQGPHFQPGPDIPPYHPADREPEPVRTRPPASLFRRRLRYLIMMGCCLLLLVTAWTWVRFYSVFAAGVMSLVAAMIPPFAAMMANADSPILREDEPEEPVEDREPPLPGRDDDGPAPSRD